MISFLKADFVSEVIAARGGLRLLFETESLNMGSDCVRRGWLVSLRRATQLLNRKAPTKSDDNHEIRIKRQCSLVTG